jgi:6-phosphogluconolactonase
VPPLEPVPLEVREVPDATGLCRAAADLIATTAAAAVAARGRFTLALSGGNTPRALYQLLAAEYATRVPWSSSQLYFGDERCVPPDNADSNYRMADDALLSRIPGLRDRTARIEGEREPPEAARRYDAVLRTAFVDGTTFDIALLGIGEDGHTASLFPGSPALDERVRWAVAAEAPPTMKTRQRVTLTYPMFANSRAVVFLVAGKDKHRILTDVLAEAGNPLAHYPAARITARQQLIYFADHAALSPR